MKIQNKQIYKLPVSKGGGSQPLPGWPIALIAALKISAKSAPEWGFPKFETTTQ